MLEHTFCHIPDIGPKTERHLWASGLLSWHGVSENSPLPLSRSKAKLLRGHIQESITHLADNDPDYFCERLPTGQHWRMFPEFRHSVAYLDIETTGLGGPDDYITTIALYDGRSIHHYVHGDNLLDFRDDIEEYQLIITYNGKCFDVPFLRNYLGVPMNQTHIDLRYVLASLGYRGGLKGCEKQFGIDREELEGVDGYFAVLLWFDFCNNGNPRALETLLAYNTLDVVNLETLMVLAYNFKLRHTSFFESRRLSWPMAPKLPFTPFSFENDTHLNARVPVLGHVYVRLGTGGRAKGPLGSQTRDFLGRTRIVSESPKMSIKPDMETIERIKYEYGW